MVDEKEHALCNSTVVAALVFYRPQAGEMGDRRRHAGSQGTLVGRYLLGKVVGKGVSSEVRLLTVQNLQ